MYYALNSKQLIVIRMVYRRRRIKKGKNSLKGSHHLSLIILGIIVGLPYSRLNNTLQVATFLIHKQLFVATFPISLALWLEGVGFVC